MSSSSPVPWEYFRELFNLDYKQIEDEVDDRPGHYQGLDPRALYTSLEDFYHIMHSPWVLGTWLDLGAGAGESALMYASLFPGREAIGIESAAARVKAGKSVIERLGLENAKLIEGDLFNCIIPHADTYFLYFPTGPVLDRILDTLRKQRKFKRLIAIESHGDLLPRLKLERSLKLIGSIPLTSPRHYPEALVFEPLEAPYVLGPHQLSFCYCFLLLENSWLGESWGLEWLRGHQYQLLYPPRTIEWRNVKVLAFSELTVPQQFLLRWRRLGELQFSLSQKLLRGEIRKIQVNPSFEVEISSGEWVKWEDIKTITTGKTLCYDSSQDYYFSPPAPWEQ